MLHYSVMYRIRNMVHTTTAARDIVEGEELTISYIDVREPREMRQGQLQGWGFTCTCPHCQMSKAKSQASDARLRKIEQLKAEMESQNSTTVTAETGAEMVELYLQEKLDIYLGPAYTMWTNWAYFMGYRFGIFNYATKELGGSIKVESFTAA